MGLRRSSMRLRLTVLVLVPLLALLAFFAYFVDTSVAQAQVLGRSRVTMDELSQPTASLQEALSQERQRAVVYASHRTATNLAALRSSEATTDKAVASFRRTADSAAVRDSSSANGLKALHALLGDLNQLSGLRSGLAAGSVSQTRAFDFYNGTVAESYQVLEQAVLQLGGSTQVLPAIAVMELAVSGDYVQQESALLNGAFAARSFPAAARRNYVSLVGAHRLLYQQSLAYLSPAQRGYLHADLSPQTAAALTALENTVTATKSTSGPPPVSQARWNATVAAYDTQIRHVVRQAETHLAAGARAQADATLRTLYITGGIGLAVVLATVLLSLWISVGLTRQLARLRDSALELAEVRLPRVVRRLRSGEPVDVETEAPALPAGPDEVGQLRAAFNAAQRTAIQAAVDEAKVRQGISEVFRNLSRRSLSLLHRQLALLDALERKAGNPEDLAGLFRVDQLTTRMRRNAESLVVLAGDTPKRVWSTPVPFVDVLRAAAAEVEDYTRIKVAAAAGPALAGRAVVDVIHMVAEFVENATLASPPNTPVRVSGDFVGTGYAIEVEDRGVGLTDDERSALNAKLADPPPFDLTGSDQLGLFVAAQLAKRHGIKAALQPSAYGGVTAVVLIPPELLADAPALDSGQESPPVPAGPLGGIGRRALAAGQEAPDAYESAAAHRSNGHGNGANNGDPDRSGPSGSGSPQPGTATPQPAVASPSAPVRATAHGLPQRVPQTSLAPQLRGSVPTLATPPGPDPDTWPAPEKAGNALSAFQRGWRQALADPALAATVHHEQPTEEDRP